CEICIFIGDEEYQNKGFGTDAMKILIRLCFNQLNLYKVGLNVLSYNERALKVYRRLGFKEEGRLRQERFVDGAYHDLIIMGLLREEWAQLEKEAL
ncbi:MAG: GNAT family protein, partial [Bacillota bacterium]|nr:GNAT family protein [Bacillota bacterium]